MEKNDNQKKKSIHIPFNEWSKDKLRAGLKSGTSRHTKYGNAGDIFSEVGNIYELIYVEKIPLAEVTYSKFRAEGCSSPDEFIKVWNDIHPDSLIDFNKLVWFHAFENRQKSPAPKLQSASGLKDGQATLEMSR